MKEINRDKEVFGLNKLSTDILLTVMGKELKIAQDRIKNLQDQITNQIKTIHKKKYEIETLKSKINTLRNERKDK